VSTMKFTTTDNYTYRGGIGNVPKAWINYNMDYKDSIWEYFYKNIKHWDYDTCDNETHDFVFEDGKAFRLEYSYWSEWHHEDEEENGLRCEETIEEISIDDANVPSKIVGRDWL